MTREELVNEYIELMGSKAQTASFYRRLAFMTKKDIISNIVALTHYYKDRHNQ